QDRFLGFEILRRDRSGRCRGDDLRHPAAKSSTFARQREGCGDRGRAEGKVGGLRGQGNTCSFILRTERWMKNPLEARFSLRNPQPSTGLLKDRYSLGASAGSGSSSSSGSCSGSAASAPASVSATASTGCSSSSGGSSPPSGTTSVFTSTRTSAKTSIGSS